MARRRMSNEQFRAYMLCLCPIAFVSILVLTLVSIFSGPDYPTFCIDDFYVSPLSKTTSSTNDTTQNHALIHFGLKIHYQPPIDVGALDIYYEHLNLTFSYLPNTTTTTTSVFLGNYSAHTLHQGNKKDIHVKDVVETDEEYYSSLLPFVLNEKRLMITASRKLKEDDDRAASLKLVLNKPVTKVFRVDLVGQWRYKGDSHLMRVVGAANVEVNDQTGKKVNKEGIQLITNQFPEPKITVAKKIKLVKN